MSGVKRAMPALQRHKIDNFIDNNKLDTVKLMFIRESRQVKYIHSSAHMIRAYQPRA